MANVHTSNRSGFIRRSGASRRQTLWIKIIETSTQLSAAGSVVLFGGFSAAVLALRPFTIVRTRILHHVRSDQSAADEDYVAAVGMAIVTDQALAAGVASVPTPMLEADSDAWFLWNAIAGHFEFETNAGYRDTGHLENVDSKAMRKVEDGFDIAIAIENGASPFLGTQTILTGRMLIKLH